jgi:hypothetical protein
MDEPFILSFSGATSAEGNQLASSLKDVLLDTDPGLTVERQRERPDTQDFGATLAIMLGTAAATAVAKGIAAWLARNSGSKLEIRHRGKLVLSATNLDSQDVPRIAEAFARKG